MTTVIVLFNLLPGISKSDYENWAKTTDIPNVKKLDCCTDFQVLRSNGLLNGSPDSPYQYIEIIQVNNMEQFKASVSTDKMQSIASQFREYAEDPIFILSESIE